jgi:hypothetical protein
MKFNKFHILSKVILLIITGVFILSSSLDGIDFDLEEDRIECSELGEDLEDKDETDPDEFFNLPFLELKENMTSNARFINELDRHETPHLGVFLPPPEFC